MRIQRRRTRSDGIALCPDTVESAAEPDYHCPQAAVAHDQVRPHAHREHPHRRVKIAQECSQIVNISRLKQMLCRSADAQPGQLRKRFLPGKAATHRRKNNFTFRRHRLFRPKFQPASEHSP